MGDPRRSLILFRFHRKPEVCRERVRVIRALNPRAQLVGLYGGPPSEFATHQKLVAPLLDQLCVATPSDPYWNWMHSDLMVKAWFRRSGQAMSFDVLFDHEWDLLLATSFESLHADADPRTVRLSGLTPLTSVAQDWAWTSWAKHRPAFERFCRFMHERYQKPPQWASHGPGAVFGRSFLEKFAEAEHPSEIFDPMNSELTYPAFAEALGFTLSDTRFEPDWSTAAGRSLGSREFNCEGFPITMGTIARALADPGGRRAFHPVGYGIQVEDLAWLAHGDTPELAALRAVQG